jgi:hypothetical protein
MRYLRLVRTVCLSGAACFSRKAGAIITVKQLPKSLKLGLVFQPDRFAKLHQSDLVPERNAFFVRFEQQLVFAYAQLGVQVVTQAVKKLKQRRVQTIGKRLQAWSFRMCIL